MPGASASVGLGALALVPPPSLELLPPTSCPECGSGDVVEDRGEGNAVCRACGLVVRGYLLDAGAEWRSFADDDGGADRSRIGAAANPLLDDALGTDVALREGGGGAEGGTGKGKVRLRTQLSAVDRAILAGGRKVDEWCTRLGAPGAGATCAKEVLALWIRTRRGAGAGAGGGGFGGDAAIAACLLIGLRQAGAARTFDEVAAVAGVGKRRVGAQQRLIERALPQTKVRTRTAAAVDEDAVLRYCRRLAVPRAAYAAAATLALALSSGPCRGRTPATICGVALFVVRRLTSCRDKQLLAKVASTVGVSPNTVLDAYRKSYAHLPAMLRDLKHLEPASRLPYM